MIAQSFYFDVSLIYLEFAEFDGKGGKFKVNMDCLQVGGINGLALGSID